jgi:alpha-mannosidase
MRTADGQQATNLGRLVDDGDEGDTYNYSPPLFDSVVDWPDSCTVMLVEPGPLRAPSDDRALPLARVHRRL